MAEIKGTALISTIEAIKARGGELEWSRIVSHLEEPAKTMFSQAIFPSNWYSLDAFVDFLEVDIRETAGGNREVLVTRSGKVIEAQLTGVYKVFVRIGSPSFVIKRIAAVHATYFKGVSIEPRFEGERKAIVKYVGFKKNQSILECVVVGFFRKALEISGARQISVNFTLPISKGADCSEVTITWA
jgi:hypothetical protein